MKFIDLYNDIFKSSKNLKAILTLHDVQMHEHIVSAVSKNYKIKTFTLQHGEVDKICYTPIASDYIFVWTNKTKTKLVNYGVNKNKIIISGRLNYKERYLKYEKSRSKLKYQIINRYNKSAQLLVTYIATNYNNYTNKLLFKSVIQIANNNSSQKGGGIYFEDAEANIYDSHFINNESANSGYQRGGGGIYINNSTINCINSILKNNTGQGGGIYSLASTLNVTNSSVIYNNSGENNRMESKFFILIIL